MMRPVALDQRGIVEVVAGIKPDAFGQAGAERLFMRLIQKGILTPSTLAGFSAISDSTKSEASATSRLPREARQRRVEHLAQPVQDHRLRSAVDQATVDLGIDLRRSTDGRQRAGRHRGQLAAAASIASA